MFAVIHCPEFYIQCERLFRPDLRSQAFVIASNDGRGGLRIIASSVEAQTLALTAGLQGAELTDILSSLAGVKEVKICSPNYELYGDISERFIKSLALLTPKVTPCDINEASLDLRGLKLDTLDPQHPGAISSVHCFGKKIRCTLNQWTGISAFVGIAPTKTLAKLASHAAQKFDHYEGVADLSSRHKQHRIFDQIPVSEIYGVSAKAARKLSAINIHTALELSTAPKAQIRRASSVVIERIAIELSGLRCRESNTNITKQNVVSNTQEHIDAQTFVSIKQALIDQVTQASRQLNRLDNTCTTVSVSLTTAPLSQRAAKIQNGLTLDLAKPSDSAATIQKLATQLLESLWHKNAEYYSIRLNLDGLNQKGRPQFSLFSDSINPSLELNRPGPQETIRFETYLSQASDRPWQDKRSLLSPSFTTKWADIPRVS